MNTIYGSYSYCEDRKKKFFEWVFIIFMMLFYPMLVAMYPILPPLIGLVGFFIIYYIESDVVRLFVQCFI